MDGREKDLDEVVSELKEDWPSEADLRRGEWKVCPEGVVLVLKLSEAQRSWSTDEDGSIVLVRNEGKVGDP